MKFYKASLLSLFTVSLLSPTAAVAEATKKEKPFTFEGFTSEVITSFISLFSSTDSDPIMKPSRALTSSCYNFTMDIYTDETPEGISWKIENANTGEIIASQEEGFYTEALTAYTHTDPICLDMDNSDICYNLVVNDTSDDYYYPTASIDLFYVDDDHSDEYYIFTYAKTPETVCSFGDFDYGDGCLVPDAEPSCACGDVYLCIFNSVSTILLFILFAPCILPCGLFAYIFVVLYDIFVLNA